MSRLRQAAEVGDIYELYNVVKEERNVLSRIDEAELDDTPLHIAASRGHADFAKAIMYLKPSFGTKLNENIDSPMQLALQNGHKQVVRDLLAADKNLVRVKGREGYTALQYVAENGDVDLLAQLLKDCPACVEDVTIQNETALHLAVKYNKFGAVEILARYLRRSHLYYKVSKSHLLNSKDRNGNTALHIAASNTQLQLIQVLTECKVDRKETNNEGFTALKQLEIQSGTDDREMCMKIKRKTPKEKHILTVQLLDAIAIVKEAIVYFIRPFLKQEEEEPALSERLGSKITKPEELLMLQINPFINMSTEQINALLVVVTLILTATYQAMLSPPGSVWQGSYPRNSTSTGVLQGHSNTNSTPAGVPQGDSNTKSTSQHVGESVMDSPFFIIFFGLNFEVFFFASCLTLGLLRAVTKSKALTMLFQILLASLMCSLCQVLQVILPKSGDANVKSHRLGQIIASSSFFAFVLLLDLLRKRYTLFLELFRQGM